MFKMVENLKMLLKSSLASDMEAWLSCCLYVHFMWDTGKLCTDSYLASIGMSALYNSDGSQASVCRSIADLEVILFAAGAIAEDVEEVSAAGDDVAAAAMESLILLLVRQQG